MTPAHVPTALFTFAPLALAAFILVALRLLMSRSAANLCIAGFLACVIPSPLMLVAHTNIALTMVGIGLACAVPAYLLADDHDDDGRGGGGPDPINPDPGSDPDPDLWSGFEREFWAHVERTRELVDA